MKQESRVSGDTSFLKALTTKVLILFTVAILGACVNIRTVKIPQGYAGAESKIVIVPIERGPIDAPRTARTNLAVWLNEISKVPSLDELKQITAETLVDWHPEVVLCERISEELAKRGRAVIQESELVPLPESLTPSKWYNPDITVFDHSAIKNRHNPIAIMEVSFEGMIIFGHGTLTVILTRVIDASSNKVIARKRTVKNLDRAEYDLRDPFQRQQYVTNFKPEFEGELGKEIPKILDKMGF